MPDYPIDAAFRSYKTNECYVFVKETYVVLNYAPGEKKKDIINGPMLITNGFPFLAGTVCENGIDCAFDIEDSEAYIFSGNQCAKIKFGPRSADTGLLIGPVPISGMFPSLKGTVFENGINAVIHHLLNTVYIFNGEDTGYLHYITKRLIKNNNILSFFPNLDGTVFQSGIGAAFNSHCEDEFFIFRGEHYALINTDYSNVDGKIIAGGGIKRIRNDWPGLNGIRHY